MTNEDNRTNYSMILSDREIELQHRIEDITHVIVFLEGIGQLELARELSSVQNDIHNEINSRVPPAP